MRKEFIQRSASIPSYILRTRIDRTVVSRGDVSLDKVQPYPLLHQKVITRAPAPFSNYRICKYCRWEIYEVFEPDWDMQVDIAPLPPSPNPGSHIYIGYLVSVII